MGGGYPEDIGWYYTAYDKTTGEGEGFFGTPESPQYDFRDFAEDGRLWEQTRGYGQGCFWADPRDLGPIEPDNPGFDGPMLDI